MLLKILLLFAIFIVAKSFIPVTNHIYSIYNNKKVWEKIRGRWILITDSTTEIGNAFCSILAEKKHNLIITDKNESKLTKQKSELEKITKVVAYQINFDTCKNFDFLLNHDIGLMINKIGFFESSSIDYGNIDVKEIIDRNLNGSILLSKTILKCMNIHGPGYVVNIAFAFVSLVPAAYMSICAAISAGMKRWSLDMHYDINDTGKCIEFMSCGFIATSRSKRKASFFVPNPDKFAKSVLISFGSNGNTTPYWPHLIQCIAVKLLPIFVIGRIYKCYANKYFK